MSISAAILCALTLGLPLCPTGVGVAGVGSSSSTAAAATLAPSITALVVSVGETPPFALTGDTDGQVQRWDLPPDGQPRAGEVLGRLPGAVVALAIGPGGAAVAVDDEGTVARVAAGLPRIGEHPGGAASVAIRLGAGAPVAATGGVDGTIRLWSLAAPPPPPSGASVPRRAVLRGHQGPVAALCFSGGRLWSAGWDGTVRGWALDRSATRGRLVRTACTGERELTAVWASEKPPWLLAAGFDGAVRRYRLRGARPRPVPVASRPHEQWIRQLAGAPSGRFVVATAPAESALLLISLSAPDAPPTVLSQPSPPACVAILPGETAALVGGLDGTLRRVALPRAVEAKR